MAHVSGELLGLEVAKNDNHGVLHFLNWDELLKATCDFSDLTISNINFFIIELLTVGIFLDMNDLSNSDIHLAEVWHVLLLLLGSFGRLLLLLLLLLLGLLLATSLSTLLLLCLLLLLLATTSCSSCLGRLLLLGFLDFGQLFELGLRGLSRVDVWEAREEAEALDLLSEAWEVLDMVQPPERVSQLDLLEVHQLSEVLSDVKCRDDICSCDVLANEEHSHGEVFVDRLNQLLDLQSLGLLDEAYNLKSIFGVLLAEKDILEVRDSGHLHHD